MGRERVGDGMTGRPCKVVKEEGRPCKVVKAMPDKKPCKVANPSSQCCQLAVQQVPRMK